MLYNPRDVHYVLDPKFSGTWGGSCIAACKQIAFWDSGTKDSRRVTCPACRETDSWKDDMAEWDKLRDLLERYKICEIPS